MGEQILNQIDEYVKALAETLGVASEHVYGVLVRQQIIEGIVFIAITLLCLLLLFIILFILHGIFFKSDYETEIVTNYWGDKKKKIIPKNKWAKILASQFVQDGYAWAIAGFISFVLIVVSLITGIHAIGRLFNPEYYAIKEILNAFK